VVVVVGMLVVVVVGMLVVVLFEDDVAVAAGDAVIVRLALEVNGEAIESTGAQDAVHFGGIGPEIEERGEDHVAGGACDGFEAYGVHEGFRCEGQAWNMAGSSASRKPRRAASWWHWGMLAATSWGRWASEVAT